MRHPILLIATLVATLMPYNLLMAQMDIDELPRAVKTHAPIKVSPLSTDNVSLDFYSLARERYELKQLRQSRNTLTITNNLTGSLTSMSESWRDVAGGNNSITILESFSLTHKYTKDKFSISTTVTAKLGYTRITFEEENDDGEIEKDPVWYKNNDQFIITITPSKKFSDNWSYGTTFKFQSQFTEGYVSSVKQEDYNLKSDFMSPGYLTLSADMVYTSPSKKIPFVLTLAPVAMSTVYVLNDEIIENAQYSYGEHTDSNLSSYAEAYGVGPMSTSKYQGGSSVKIALTKTFGKSKNFSYTTSVYSFYGWISLATYRNTYTNLDEYNEAITEWTALDEKDNDKPMYVDNPTMQWENKITAKASKIFSTTLTFNAYYSKADNLKVRTQTLLSVGFYLSYKNK